MPVYDLVNWQEADDGSVKFVTVGRFDRTLNQNPKLEIDEETIVWNGRNKQVRLHCVYTLKTHGLLS